MEKIFTVIEMSEDKNLKIRAFYSSEADIWWNTNKGQIIRT